MAIKKRGKRTPPKSSALKIEVPPTKPEFADTTMEVIDEAISRDRNHPITKEVERLALALTDLYLESATKRRSLSPSALGVGQDRRRTSAHALGLERS
jgi:hypothetical protein